MARILVISQRRLRPSICRTSQNEYEDVIASVDAVDLIAPAARQRFLPAGLAPFEKMISRRTGLDFERRPWPQRVELASDYDLIVVIAQHPSDLNVLDAVPDWRQRCGKAVAFIEELWTVELKYAKMLRPLTQFDLVLCGHERTVEPLAKQIGVPVVWEGVGIDAIRFCPYPEPPRRVIDFLSMGRRGEGTHRALLHMARTRDFYYEYDTVKAKHVLSSSEHRQLLADRIKRSRYFLANKPKVDATHQRFDQEEVGMRYYEGAAGGAVMIGEPPENVRFHEHFGWQDACIPFPYNTSRIEDLLDELDQQPNRLARIRRDNVVNSLLRHDWVYRYQRMLSLLEMKPSEASHDRIDRLHKLAALVSESFVPVAHSERVLV